MKILVISHSCVTDVNQQQFVALSSLPDVQVLLMMPDIWRSDYTGELHEPTILPTVTFPVCKVPIAVPGNVSLHFYKRLPLKRLRHFGPDAILSTQEPWSLSGLQAVALSRLLRIPLVFQTNQNILKKYPAPFCWIEQLSYRTAAAALAYSEEARQVMLAKGLKRPSRVVPYGTDISLFQKEPNFTLRQTLGVDGKVVLGYIGRIVKEKGLDTLVEAVAVLQSRQPSAEIAVLIVGTGEGEETLRAQIKQAGLQPSFVFTGAVTHRQAGEYMNCIDIFVLPSRTTPTWKEQFGRVIIEALACGIPVVGSDSGQIPVLIQGTGGGLVFAEGKAADLAEKLSSLIHNLAQRELLGETGRSAVHSSYTYEAVAQQLLDVLESTSENIT
jgi:glycosyltransferase involved in cell wall biosynthesis